MRTKAEPVDMSEKAITTRLEIVRALYKLMVSFRDVRVDTSRPVEPPTC